MAVPRDAANTQSAVDIAAARNFVADIQAKNQQSARNGRAAFAAGFVSAALFTYLKNRRP